MTIRFPEFGDFCDVAADILGTTPEQIASLPNVGLAESALATPHAGFGDVELYATLLEKAAILLERLARNHPLPDTPRAGRAGDISFRYALRAPLHETPPKVTIKEDRHTQQPTRSGATSSRRAQSTSRWWSG